MLTRAVLNAFALYGTAFFYFGICLMTLALTGALAWAAIVNHFWRHTTRPIVIASSFMFSTLTLFFAEQCLIDVFPSTVPWHSLLVRSGPVNVILMILLVLGIGSWFYTAALAYPDLHRGKGQPHDRVSHENHEYKD